MAFAEVYWFGGDHDPDRRRGNNHQHCARCRAISAIRFGGVLLGRRIETAPEMISTPSWGTWAESGVISTSAKPATGLKALRLAELRHVDIRVADIPCCAQYLPPSRPARTSPRQSLPVLPPCGVLVCGGQPRSRHQASKPPNLWRVESHFRQDRYTMGSA